jgi:hypothetical protein
LAQVQNALEASKGIGIMSYIQADAASVKAQIINLINAYPELAGDDELRADMFEGETDLEKVVSRCLNASMEASSMVDAIKSRESDLRERRSRYERKAAAMKALILDMMTTADIPKMELAEATLSMRDPVPGVNVVNVDDLPQGYFKVEKKADKTAIKKSILAGETVPGAELELGSQTLTIRTK